MKRKVFLSVIVAGTLGLSCAFAADYSKMGNQDLINLAGKVAPKDYPDYKMEIHKRVLEMKVKDARIFHENLREAKRKANETMTLQQKREYHDAISLEVQKRLDKMTPQQARDSGLLGGHHFNGPKGDCNSHPRDKRGDKHPPRQHLH